MGKVKRRPPSRNSHHHDGPRRSTDRKIVSRRQHSQNVPKNTKAKFQNGSDRSNSSTRVSTDTSAERKVQQNQKPKTPFVKWDRILLVGEGDFSFTLSLRQNYDVSSIVSTCLDTEDELTTKYEGVTRRLKAHGIELHPEKLDGISEEVTGNEGKEEEWAGFSPVTADGDVDGDELELSNEPRSIQTVIRFGIDATKLSTVHKKILRFHSPFTKIVFNFPHVGGLSTDVNRQVRSNQQLLVNFFNAAKPLLATASNPAKLAVADGENYNVMYEYDSEDQRQQETEHFKHGQILVTLFEGEPYTLWNIRDLARHSGLRVVESFKFPWCAYPGYRHARTLGDITTGKDRGGDGQRKGKWRGEEREARCYVLALQDDTYGGNPGHGSRKRKREGERDESD